MTSSYTTRKRLLKQGTGDSPNSWGVAQGTGDFDLMDFALDGVTSKTITGDWTLTTANGTTSGNEAGARILKLAGSVAATITLPALEGWYIVINGSSAAQTVASSGGGTSVSVAAGERVFVACDATNVTRLTLSTMTTALDMGSHKITSVTDPTSAQDAATKAYVDATAFNMAAGSLPGQVGNANKYLQTDGSAASWQTIDVTLFSAPAATVRAGTSLTTALTPGDTYNGLAEVTLTSSSNHIAADMSTFVNAVHTMTENTTLDNPTNPKVGQGGDIRIIQHASSAKTLAMGSNWKRVGGALALSTTLGGTTILSYKVITSTFILYDLSQNPS